MADATEPSLSDNFAPAASFEVKVGSHTFTQSEPKGLEQVTIETHIDKIGMARLTITHSFKAASVKIGDDVEVSVGGSTRKAFKGYITASSRSTGDGVEKISITAMDPLIKLANTSKTKVWGGQPTDKHKDTDVANFLISDGGGSAGTVDSTTGERPYIMQRQESNLGFLKRLAARNGFLVYAEEGKIHFKKPQFSDPPVEISLADVISEDFSQSDKKIPSKVKVIGWDYIGKKQVSGEASPSDIEPLGSGSPPDPTTFSGEEHIVDNFVDSDAAAAEMAKSHMNTLARKLVQGTFTVPGDGRLYPGMRIKTSGRGEGQNPEGLVVGVRHVIEPGATFQTTFWVVGNTQPE